MTAVEPFSSGRFAVQAGAAALLHVGGVDGRVHVSHFLPLLLLQLPPSLFQCFMSIFDTYPPLSPQTWDTRKLSTRFQSFPIWLPQPSSSSLPPTPPLVTCLLWHECAGCVAAGRSDGGLWVGDASGAKTVAGRASGGAVTAMARLVVACGCVTRVL